MCVFLCYMLIYKYITYSRHITTTTLTVIPTVTTYINTRRGVRRNKMYAHHMYVMYIKYMYDL